MSRQEAASRHRNDPRAAFAFGVWAMVIMSALVVLWRRAGLGEGPPISALLLCAGVTMAAALCLAALAIVRVQLVAEELLAAFRTSLDAELAAGRLKSRSTVRSYERAVENLLAWAGPPSDRAALADAADRYLQELALGRIPHRSDHTFAKPAFSRLLAAVPLSDRSGVR